MKRYLPLILLLAAGTAAAGDGWLAHASKAVRTANYRGTIVYLRDGKMDTLHIVHRYRDGHERERLVSLTGAPREVIRDDGVVTCVLPTKRMVLVARRPVRSLLHDVATISAGKLGDNYAIHNLGTRRLAGRMCRVIVIRPKDKFRYGYRLLIDEKTHLPLKLDLLRGDDVLEQLMFTNIEFPKKIADSALKTTYDTHNFRWVRHRPESQPPAVKSSLWHAAKLPPGFHLAENGVRWVGGSTIVRQLLFTDGIATVSAFVAPTGRSYPGFDGSTTMGAVNAFGRQAGSHQITVVGEVPETTAQFIAEHLRQIPAAAAAKR